MPHHSFDAMARSEAKLIYLDRKSTRPELQSQSNLVCRLLLEKKNMQPRGPDPRTVVLCCSPLPSATDSSHRHHGLTPALHVNAVSPPAQHLFNIMAHPALP